jgi:tetraacyldisaccharide 4'-kinase
MTVRRPLLLPLAPLYGAALALKRQLYRWRWLKPRRLENPVISVGSVSAGGAGKTPVVLMLAEILRHRGYAVRILTRGYKRISRSTVRVEPFDDAAWHGDEPVLLAQRSAVPVYVGEDRYQAGVMAEQNEPTQKLVVHLMDDGFQHRKLDRDVDIVLLTQEDLEDTLLPAGNLREPLSAVAQADVVVLREEEADSLRSVVAQLSDTPGKPAIWVIRRDLTLGDAGQLPLPTMPFAFCGIARPQNFTKMLAAQGYEPMGSTFFPDHHHYTDADIAKLLHDARLVEANGFVTTEKDAVKLTPIMRDHLETLGPIVIARLSVALLDEKEALLKLVSMVGRLDRRKR